MIRAGGTTTSANNLLYFSFQMESLDVQQLCIDIVYQSNAMCTFFRHSGVEGLKMKTFYIFIATDM